MVRKCVIMTLVMFMAVSAVSFGQNQLDSRILDPAKDPDIEMFMNSWTTSRPYNTHGAITERAIFTKAEGDPLWPTRRGAVLVYVSSFSRGTMNSYDITTPTTLKGEQEVLYIVDGTGVITANKKSHDLREGIFVLVPADLEFTIKNTGDKQLVMYIIREPIPEGFRPNKDLLVKDENSLALRNDGFLTVHWAHNGKNVFNVQDGLGTLELVNSLWFEPMTIGQPHSHNESTEEVWCVTEGKNLAFLGKEIRWQPAGMAYRIPSTNYTPHSNINTGDVPVKFLYFARFRDHETRK